MDKIYFVWANPLTIDKDLDHTWATTYDPVATCPPDTQNGAYWYCWGICHMTGSYNPTARQLHYGTGDYDLASCICEPNKEDNHAGIPGWYGQWGVCHQVANRILYATTGPDGQKMNVEGAHGYWLSHFLYGTYGGPDGNWQTVLAGCGVTPSEGDMNINELDDHLLEQRLRKQLGDSYRDEMLNKLLVLKQEILIEKESLAKDVEAGNMAIEQFANSVNTLLTEYLPKFAEVVGKENVKAIFDVAPGGQVQLLDSEIAAQEDKHLR